MGGADVTDGLDCRRVRRLVGETRQGATGENHAANPGTAGHDGEVGIAQFAAHGIAAGRPVGEGVDLGGDVGVDDGGMWVGHHARTVGDPWLDLALDDDRTVRRMRGEAHRHGADDDQQRWNDDA